MTVRLLLNGEPVAVEGQRADRMLLAWLRREAGLTGAKEGCGEGDCGACTVALGELDEAGETLRLRAVNACILFLGAVDGKAVFTVEGLAAADGGLHPVQRALVDHHGSQCGFCTPGFVMTLFVHWWHRAPTDRASLAELLAGNLCRCTGYRSIIDAAQAMGALTGGDELRDAEAGWVARLRAWRSTAVATPAAFARPRSADELARHLVAKPDALLIGGGTDAGLWVTKALGAFEDVVTTAEVTALKTIEHDGDVLDVGAGASWTDLLPHADAHWPAFGRMLRRFGSPLVRNTATIGGNLGSASPIGDGSPVLLALEATLVLRRGDERRVLAIADFFLDYKRTALAPGEFIERVRLPLPDRGVRLAVEKVSKRFDQDISAVLVALAARLDDGRLRDVRVALGGMAATPKRALAAEAALEGVAPDDDGALARASAALGEGFTPITDMRASAAYRHRVARAALATCLAAVRGAPVALPTAPQVPAS